MSDILSGAKVTLTKWTVRIYWPSLGDSSDFRFASKVGSWVGKNEKVLGKTKANNVVKLIYEQFGSLSDIKVEDRNNFGEISWLKS